MSAPEHRPSTGYWHWTLAGGAGITLLGLTLLAMPVGDRELFAHQAGWLLALGALIELLLGLKSRRSPEGRIAVLLSGIAFAAALLILVRPDAFPMLFVAFVCLGARGLGAVVAAFIGERATRRWVLGRGGVDVVLAAILAAGAPVSAVISILSGAKWPRGRAAILGNFVAVSMISSGICLIGIALAHLAAERRRAAANG